MAENKPAYLIVQLDVKDFDAYLNRYAMPVMDLFRRIGAEVVAASAAPNVVEGAWSGNWTVIVRFPSMAAATRWYASDEYAPLRELRKNVLTKGGTALFVDGFDPAALGL